MSSDVAFPLTLILSGSIEVPGRRGVKHVRPFSLLPLVTSLELTVARSQVAPWRALPEHTGHKPVPPGEPLRWAALSGRGTRLSLGVGAPHQPRRSSSSALSVSAGVNRDGCSPSAPRARSIPHGRHNLERVSKETRVGDVTAAVVHAVQCAPLLGLLPCGRYGMCLMSRECSGVASPTGDSYTIVRRCPCAS